MKTYLDIFPIEPKLTWEGKNSYSTKTGSFFGFISCLLTFLATIYFSKDFICNSNAQITFNTSYNYTQKLNFQNIPFMFMLQNIMYEPLENEKRLYTVGGVIISQIKINETYTDTNFKEILFENCDLSKHFGNFSELFKNISYLEYHYCPVPGQNLTVFGNEIQSNSDFALMGLFVNRCQNSTTKNDCLPADEVNLKLQTVFTQFVALSYFFDHSNYKSPGQFYTFIESGTMSTNLFKKGDITLTASDYISDNGWIFENKILQQYHSISKPVYNVDLKKEGLYPGSFGSLSLQFGNFKNLYTRNYIKIQFVIANIGGIMKSIFFMAKILSHYFTFFFYNLELIHFFVTSNSSDLYQSGTASKNIIIKMQNDKFNLASSQLQLNPILKNTLFCLNPNKLNAQLKESAKELGTENLK
jgi:hypothetical protein